jgi:2'-5' RNA ligase
MPVIRSFIAVELSLPVQQKLDQVARQLQQKMSELPVRWVTVKNIHLTLCFLGDVSTSHLPQVISELQAEASQHQPFELTVGQLGAFPNANRPRVVWVGIQSPPVLAALQSGLAARMERLGYTNEEREFTPHLTLGRVTRTASPVEVRQIGESVQQFEVGQLGVVTVEAVHLFKSDLTPTGAVYERLASSPLGVSPAGG